MHDELLKMVSDACTPKPVPDPAIAVSEAARTLANSKGKAQEVTFKATAFDDHGVIIGIAASPALDHDNEITHKDAVLNMAYDFCGSAAREFKSNHGETLKADLVASWPGAPIYAEDGVTITGIDITKGSESHWFVGVKPHDSAVYEAAKAGEIAGFSWGGLATKVST